MRAQVPRAARFVTVSNPPLHVELMDERFAPRDGYEMLTVV
jgi:hypothetical protein